MRRLSPEPGYLDELTRRSRASHAHTAHQSAGLLIAEVLGDLKHRALYIKLAKKHGGDALLRIAKTIAEKKNVKNPGAYFMTLLKRDVPP